LQGTGSNDSFCGATTYFDIRLREETQDPTEEQPDIEALRHIDSAAPPDLEADANIAKLLQSTRLDSRIAASEESRRPKCFVPGTRFRGANGTLTNVENLEKHEMLLGHDGTRVEVVDVKRHAVDERAIVQLTRESGEQIIITADHRVVVLRKGEQQTIRAGYLREVDTILFTNGEKRVSKRSWKESVPVFQVKFEPDVAMETFYIQEVHEPFLTKGYKAFTHRSNGKKKEAAGEAAACAPRLAPSHRSTASLPSDSYLHAFFQANPERKG